MSLNSILVGRGSSTRTSTDNSLKALIKEAFPAVDDIVVNSSRISFKANGQRFFRKSIPFERATWLLGLVALGLNCAWLILEWSGAAKTQVAGFMAAAVVVGWFGKLYAVRLNQHLNNLFYDPITNARELVANPMEIKGFILYALWAVRYQTPWLARVESINPFSQFDTNKIEPMVDQPLVAALRKAISFQSNLQEAERLSQQEILDKQLQLAENRLRAKFAPHWARGVWLPGVVLGLSAFALPFLLWARLSAAT